MIDMPPRRRLPQQTRDRMLVDLREKLNQRPQRPKTPYAVAAGVAALVAGGVVIATTVQGAPDTGTGAGADNRKGVEMAAQRCQDASKKVGGFPAKANWRVVAHTGMAGFTEIAFVVAGKPVFCEVTATSVTMSKFDAKPNYVPGSKTGTLFLGNGRLYGLVVDPSWHGIDAFEQGALDSNPSEPVAGWKFQDDMVLWWPEYSVPLTVSAPGKRPASPLPKAPDSTATVVDRPYTGPAPDRTSSEGQVLAKCIDRSKQTNPLADPDTWQPGPMMTGAGKEAADVETMLVIRGVDHVTTCSGNVADTRPGGLMIDWWGGDMRVVRLPTGNQPVLAPSPNSLYINGENRAIVYGSVTVKAASMTLTTAEHETVTAQVRNGMFMANAGTDQQFVTDDPVITSVVVKDAHGKVLYQGKPATK